MSDDRNGPATSSSLTQATDYGGGAASDYEDEVASYGGGGDDGAASMDTDYGGGSVSGDQAARSGSLGFGEGGDEEISGLTGVEESGDESEGRGFGGGGGLEEGYRARVRAIRAKRAAAAVPRGRLKDATFDNMVPGASRRGAAEALSPDFNCFRFRRDDKGDVYAVPNCMPSVVGDKVRCGLPNWWQAQRAHEAYVQKINKCRVTRPTRGPDGELVLEPVKNPDGTYAKWGEESGQCYSADVGVREAAYRANAAAGRPTFVENGVAMHATPAVLCRAHMQRFHPDMLTYDRERDFAAAIETDHRKLRASAIAPGYAAPMFRWAKDADLPDVVDGDMSDRALMRSRAHQRGDVDPVRGVDADTIRMAGIDVAKSMFSRDQVFVAATGAKNMAALRKMLAEFRSPSETVVPMDVTRVTGRKSTQAEKFNERVRMSAEDLDKIPPTRVLRSARAHGIGRAAAAAAALGGQQQPQGAGAGAA